jgi:3-oxoacyl-[acyl-carrier protein] reductase
MGPGRRPERRSVINISSIAALSGSVGQAGYSAAKAGIIGLTRTVAKEWGRYNVTVNAVAFGVVDTRLTLPDVGGTGIKIGKRTINLGINPQVIADIVPSIPLGPIGTPQDAAGTVYMLCLEEAGYITGQVITCDGGYNL